MGLSIHYRGRLKTLSEADLGNDPDISPRELADRIEELLRERWDEL